MTASPRPPLVRPPPGLAARRIAAEILDGVSAPAPPARRAARRPERRARRALPERDRALVRQHRRDRAAPARHAAAICCGRCSSAALPADAPRGRDRAAARRRADPVSRRAGSRRGRSLGAAGAGRPPRRALCRAGQRRAAADRPRRRAAVSPRLDTVALDTPDWLMRAGSRPMARPRRAPSRVANRQEPALDLTVKSDADAWAAPLGGRVLPTGSVRMIAHGPVPQLPATPRAPGGCRTPPPPAGAAARRRARPTRRRSLRRARRQDRAARRGRRPGHRGRPLAAAARAAAAEPRAARPHRRDRRRRCRRMAGRAVRRRAARRALLVDRHDPPPSRHPLAQARDRHRGARGAAAPPARRARANSLKPGGTLVYCTCSLEPEEGERRRSRAARRRAPRGAAGRSRRRGRGLETELLDAGRRPAHAALPLARSRPAHGRSRRLLSPPDLHQRMYEAGLPRRWPRAAARSAIIAARRDCDAVPEGEASRSMSRRFSRGARPGCPCSSLRGGVLRRLAESILTGMPRHPLAVLPRQDRPAADRAAGPAHRRRHPRERNLRRPLRLRRQGRDLRRPLAVRDARRRRTNGRQACSASAGCAICAPPTPASPAPTPARWSTNGSRSQGAWNPVAWQPEILARRIIVVAQPGAADPGRRRRPLLSPLPAQPDPAGALPAPHRDRGARRRAAPAGVIALTYGGALHGRPGAPHAAARRSISSTSSSGRSCPTAGTSAAIPAR